MTRYSEDRYLFTEHVAAGQLAATGDPFLYRLRCLRQFRRKHEGHCCIDLSVQALVRVLHLYPKELDDDSQLSKELGGAEPRACKGSSPGDSSRHVWGVIREVPQFLDLFAPHFQKRNPTDYRPFDHQVHLQSVPNDQPTHWNRWPVL